MPITRSDLTQRMGPRGRRAEYTRKCGWIDWAHATPDRDDLKSIWAALGDKPLLADGSLDTSRIALIRTADDGLHSYIRVKFKLEMSFKQRLGSRFPKQHYTAYVKTHPQHNRAYYQKAALSLYLYACGKVEYHQSTPILEWKSASSFSMEDMISNLMAFHQLTYSLSADTMITEAGGWVNRDDALNNSQYVFDAMVKKGAPQPRSSFKEWYKAYLFNDVAEIDDRRGGWHIVPEFFQLSQPIPFHENDPPGSPIGIEWTEYDASASLIRQPGLQQDGYLAHLRGQRALTGPAGGAGRKPGPLGLV